MRPGIETVTPLVGYGTELGPVIPVSVFGANRHRDEK